MPRGKLPKGVHRVRRQLRSGVRFHFYAWRGGPKFWQDIIPYPTDPQFFREYAAVSASPEPLALSIQKLVDDFFKSAAMPEGERSQKDIKKWAGRFQAEFGKDPVLMFEERASRGELNRWRAQWLHSPKQHDVAGTHAVRVLNWAVEEGFLKEHHCHNLKKLYKPNRSEIVWTTEDRNTFAEKAPKWAIRILEAGCETGLRPADLVSLDLEKHIQTTRKGRRLCVDTAKRKRTAYIPITDRLAQIIDETPQGQQFLLVDGRGKKVTARRASNEITRWRRISNVAHAADGREKSLNDTRGTAATKLLNAGATLAQIANCMGWSVRYAANVIEYYATVSPDESELVLAKLNAAKTLENIHEM
ncbi:site-specific integrase [uncultured Litoreibacter sp.]|uniref:tyrosine-type recombinase/integrase n=1 Tax=uncultured Litoreibacter sp. TaxID=1392394 RepID=UPI00260CC355|nr:site-specific integrase [uncultured Litoreibacter sp.]